MARFVSEIKYNFSPCNYYLIACALFGKKDPTKLLARPHAPVFAPALEWEKVGHVPNVVAVTGLVRERNRRLYYYAGAGKYIGAASAPLPKVP